MKTVKKETVFSGNFIKVRADTIEDDAHQLHTYEVTESGEGVLIAALPTKNSIILIRQWRHNHGTTYEVPAGTIEPGEDPLHAAQRELKEETGITAKSWRLLSKHHNGVHDEGFNYFFMAEDITRGTSSLESDEAIEPFEELSFEKATKLIQDAKIPDLRNRACIWLAKLVVKGY